MKNFKLDQSGLTKAYYFLNKNDEKYINKKILNKIINLADKNKNNFRVCLHDDKKSQLHSMINIIYKDQNPEKPHMHIFKDEVYHLIKGKLLIQIVKKNKKKKHLLNNLSPILMIPKRTLHKVMTISKYSIFHEIRKGPFKENDSIFK